MKIINKTDWDSSHLKKIFYACINLYEKLGNERKTDLNIKITYSKPKKERTEYLKTVQDGKWMGWNTYRGRASLSGTYMKLRIPKDNIDKEKLCRLFLHEYEHNLGYGHDATTKDMCFTTAWGDFKWVYQYYIEKKIIKGLIDYKQERFEKARNNVILYERKLNRTKKLLKKWKSVVRYYDKRYLKVASNNKEIKIKGE